MAQPIICDCCDENNQARFLVTDLATAAAMSVCNGCAPAFLDMLQAQFRPSPDDSIAPDSDATDSKGERHPVRAGRRSRKDKFPYTEHVIPPGMRDRGEGETEADAGEPASEGTGETAETDVD